MYNYVLQYLTLGTKLEPANYTFCAIDIILNYILSYINSNIQIFL